MYPVFRANGGVVQRMFIAGAKCPRCQEQDKIRWCRDAGREWIECVACGYEEERPTEVTPVEEAPAEAGAVKWRPKA